jgi:putative NIF3 family GTP cyclohydrolase 1 type 2
MKIKEILSVLEEMAPLAYAEAFDNVGLLLETKMKKLQASWYVTMH